MKLHADVLLAAGVTVLVMAFFLVLCYFNLEELRAKHLAEAAAQGADPVALRCAMGGKEACVAWAKRAAK